MDSFFDPKGQNVRLLDIFVIGPLMIWGGLKIQGEPLGSLLALAGAGTIVFNAVNFEKVRKLSDGVP